jgi:hypothetical protein
MISDTFRDIMTVIVTMVPLHSLGYFSHTYWVHHLQLEFMFRLSNMEKSIIALQCHQPSISNNMYLFIYNC